MRDDHDGRTRLRLFIHHAGNALHSHGVEAGRGFVEEQQGWAVDDRACERNPLTLPARGASQWALRELADAEALDALFPRAADVHAGEASGELDVLATAEVGVTERVVPHPTEPRTHFGRARFASVEDIVDRAG